MQKEVGQSTNEDVLKKFDWLKIIMGGIFVGALNSALNLKIDSLDWWAMAISLTFLLNWNYD